MFLKFEKHKNYTFLNNNNSFCINDINKNINALIQKIFLSS